MKIGSWVEVPLEAIAAPCRYPIGDGDHGAIKPEMYTTSGIPYIRVADIGDGEILKDKLVYISPEVHRDNPKSHLFPDDIVISKTGATIGKVALIPPEMQVANTTSSVGKVTVDPKKALSRYVLQYMRSPRFQTAMWAVSHKSAQPGFNIKDLKQFKIPLPPLAEQKQIVKLLDEADELRKLRARADRCTAALIPALFYEMFGEPRYNTKNWRVEAIGETLKILHRYPTFYGTSYVEDGVPVARIGNILPSNMLNPDLSSYARVPHDFSAKFPKTILKSGDLVMAVRGDTTGKIGSVPSNLEGANISPNLIRISPDESKVTSEYLLYLLLLVPTLVTCNVTDTAKKSITAENISNIKIPVPNLLLQKEFAMRVAEIRALEASQTASRRRLDDLFQSFLHHAFQGD